MALKIAQLSDCHLQADPTQPYRGQDADANLANVWKKALAWGPDLVLLTGDLSEDASEESYRRLGALMQAEVPILALPGNHDDKDLMRARFPRGPWDGPLAFERDNWLIVLTDSTAPGHVEGRFSDQAIERIGTTLSENDAEHVIIALHHQPIPVSAPWIDRYPLAEPESFLELVESEPRMRCVLWGHIHHHFAEERNGVLFLGGPSTAANSLPRADRFELDPAGPACRRLECGDAGTLAYGQLFANAA